MSPIAIRYVMIDSKGNEHDLSVRTYEAAVEEVLRMLRVKIKAKHFNQPNEPSLF